VNSTPSYQNDQAAASKLSSICDSLGKGDNPHLENEAQKNLFIETKVKELFELFEKCAMAKSGKLDLSRTTFDENCILDINNEHAFLQLEFDSEQLELIQTDEIEAVVQLNYTSQDIKPIRGRIINERSFQGVVEKLYLVEDKWYYLNPHEFNKVIAAAELILTEDFITNRILFDIFG